MMDRERLIELIKKGVDISRNVTGLFSWGDVADYLLANGVIVPPCKVYDVVYCIVFLPSKNELAVKKGFVKEINIKRKFLMIKIVDCETEKYANLNTTVSTKDFGKTVFLTKEEAEAKLEKRGKENA